LFELSRLKMKKIILPLLFIGLLSSSCNQNKEIAQVIRKRSDLIKQREAAKPVVNKNPYEVNFHPVTPKYKLETREIVENFYNQRINRGNFWGQFLVAKNGQIIFEDYKGYANYQNKDQITLNTPMHVASVGKVYTGVTVLRLVQQKKFFLDQMVNTILPEFPYDGISVRMLLNHRSGLPYYGHFTAQKGVWDTRNTITNKDVLNLLKTKNIRLDFRPDTRFKYCNTNYVILALIVEKVTQKPFQDAMKQLVLEPLKMHNTFVLDNLDNKENVTQSYYANNSRMRWDYMDGTYGDKNIYTTARDLLKLDMALYSDNFLNETLKNEMFRGYSYERPGQNNYGLGIRMIEPKDEGDLFAFHNGWWRGNRTSYVTLKKDTITIICFNNHNSQLAYKTKELAPKLGNYPFIKVEG